MSKRVALLLGGCVAMGSMSALAQVEGDVEASGDGYINTGGFVLKTGLGECLQTGRNAEDNLINACEGIDDADTQEAVADAAGEAVGAAEEAVEEVAKAPAATQTATIDTRDFSDQVLFETDSASLNSSGQNMMDNLFGALSEYKGITSIAVRGHTDSTGSEAYNQALSERRAETVATSISSRYPGAAMDVQGMGESEPVATNDTAEGRQLNRRVEIEITATRMIFN
ncbi:MAG: OmpA family protein [Granulosicoccus sp.]